MADDDAVKARQARAKLDADRRGAVEKAMKERKAETNKSNAEAMKRMDEAKPTPTQEENDLAAVGLPVMEKEDHGAPEQEDAPPLQEHRQAQAGTGTAPYRTRAAEAEHESRAASHDPKKP